MNDYRTDAPAVPRYVVVGVFGRVAAVDIETGREVWRNLLEGTGNGSVTLLVAGDKVLCAPERNDLICLDYSAGNELWRTTTRGQGRASMLLVGEKLLIGRGGFVTCVDLDGRRLWDNPLEDLGSGPTSLAVPDQAVQADVVGR